jgi:hypothetical protein
VSDTTKDAISTIADQQIIYKLLFMKNKFLLLFLFVFIFKISFAQYATVYPTNWWVGMKHNKIQLIFLGDHEGLSNEKVSINYPGVTITGTHKFPNSKISCS